MRVVVRLQNAKYPLTVVRAAVFPSPSPLPRSCPRAHPPPPPPQALAVLHLLPPPFTPSPRIAFAAIKPFANRNGLQCLPDTPNHSPSPVRPNPKSGPVLDRGGKQKLRDTRREREAAGPGGEEGGGRTPSKTTTLTEKSQAFSRLVLLRDVNKVVFTPGVRGESSGSSLLICLMAPYLYFSPYRPLISPFDGLPCRPMRGSALCPLGYGVPGGSR